MKFELEIDLQPMQVQKLRESLENFCHNNFIQQPVLRQTDVSGSLPTVDEAGIAAVKISEMVDPPLTAQEQAFFIAGFSECIKWLSSNDR